MVTSACLRVLTERGFIHQCTDLEGLDKALKADCVTAYIGFDATAQSLHVGSLTQIMMLRWLQKTGHRPLVLMGGGTTKIGDPSGKDKSRQLLSEDTIAANMAAIGAIFERFLTFGEGPGDAVMVNNAAWLDGLHYIPFLRDVGRHFSLNTMLGFESVRSRLERQQNLSFLEFNYMILQAYDFVELHRRYGCSLQMGGGDQWGNIVSGVELGRRLEGAQLWGLTSPLLTTASGAKMGKSAQGAVWLAPALLSDYDFWQFWRNVEDGDVGRFLRLFTEIPLDEIVRLEALEGAEVNTAKVMLADAVTVLCRGPEAARQAQESARTTFSGGLGAQLPSTTLGEDAVGLLTILTRLGFTASNAEGRRAIQQGGVRLDGVVVTDPHLSLQPREIKAPVRLSLGKKRHGIIMPPSASWSQSHRQGQDTGCS